MKKSLVLTLLLCGLVSPVLAQSASPVAALVLLPKTLVITPITGATAYTLYSSPDMQTWTKVATQATPSFTLPAVTVLTYFGYSITDANGKESQNVNWGAWLAPMGVSPFTGSGLSVGP